MLAAGSDLAIVRAARSVIAETMGDDVASRLFGVRTLNAKGNPVASAVERAYAGGLRAGQAFAVVTAGVTVAGGYTTDDALGAIEQAERLLAHAHVA